MGAVPRPACIFAAGFSNHQPLVIYSPSRQSLIRVRVVAPLGILNGGSPVFSPEYWKWR